MTFCLFPLWLAQLNYSGCNFLRFEQKFLRNFPLYPIGKVDSQCSVLFQLAKVSIPGTAVFTTNMSPGAPYFQSRNNTLPHLQLGQPLLEVAYLYPFGHARHLKTGQGIEHRLPRRIGQHFRIPRHWLSLWQRSRFCWFLRHILL